MIIVQHRRNTINLLRETPVKFGVEVDIRSYGDKLIIHHDPFINKVNFEDWIKEYKHSLLVLNIKEEGLEKHLISLMKLNKIENFFFLDQSFPFLIKTIMNGESRTAVRVSEYESINTALSLAGKAAWIWVDFFKKFPLDKESYLKLKQANFKLCLVSPELQGHSINNLKNFQKEIKNQNIIFEAVCTKYPDLWLDSK